MSKFFCFFLIGFQFVFSQKTIPLLNALELLTKKHNVDFSYNPEQISTYKTVYINLLDSLPIQIIALQKQTHLTFQKVNNTNYIIFKDKISVKSICAKFIDPNGNPVENAQIWGLKESFTTDKNGFFRYIPKKTSELQNSISVLAEDYKIISIPVSNLTSNCKTFVLKKEIITLKEITISNYLTKGIFKNKSGDFKVDITNTGVLPGVIEPDIIQSLQFIPGVQSPDENIFGLHIRGSTPDQNLVLYDNTKVYQDAHFYGFVSAFNPSIVNSVTLNRSSTKSKYGEHAGGVIAVGVDNTIPQKLTMGLSSTLTHSSAYLKSPLVKDKLGITVSARRSLTDVFDNITTKNLSEIAFQNTSIENASTNPEERNTRSDNDFKYEDYSAKLIFKPYKSLTFSFGFASNKNDLKFDGLNSNRNVNNRERLLTKNQLFNESVSFKNKTLGTHTLQLGYTTFSKIYTGLDKFNRNTSPRLLEITFGKENFIDETSLRYKFKKQLNKNFNILAGYERNRYESGFTAKNRGTNLSVFEDNFNGKETAQAFSSDLELDIKKWRANLGVRRQFFSRLNRVFWEPRLFINYSPLHKLWIKYSFEKKHQSVSRVTDLRNDGLGNLFDRLWVISTNEEFPILSSTQSSLGLDYQKRGWTVDFEVYVKKLEGIGILLTDNIFEPRNVTGNNDIKGLDLLIKKQWKNYSTWLSYSFLDSQYTFQEINNNIPFNGDFDITHSLVWTHNYSFKKFEFSLGYKFRTGIPYTSKQLDLTAPEGNFISFDDYNGKRLPNYHRLDGSILYNTHLDKNKRIKSQFGISFQNITNKRNTLSKDFRVVEINNPTDSSNPTLPNLEEITRKSLKFTPNIFFKIDFSL